MEAGHTLGKSSENKKRAQAIPVRSLVIIAVMAALTAVCAWLTIPSAVPFTLQTFAVFLTLKLLGGKKGTLSILVYILLGAAGLPVFSSFKGGVGVLAGPTGGYILGFLLTGLVYLVFERFLKNRWLENAVLFAGLLVCYFFGTLRFMHVMSLKGADYTFLQGLTLCVFPYLIPDILKLALADLLARKLKRFV